LLLRAARSRIEIDIFKDKPIQKQLDPVHLKADAVGNRMKGLLKGHSDCKERILRPWVAILIMESGITQSGGTAGRKNAPNGKITHPN
jgi:hypothetical protein